MSDRRGLVRIASFNLRYGTAEDGENAWPNRRGLVLATLAKIEPDILGTQEGLPFQLEELDQGLSDYSRVGLGRYHGLAVDRVHEAYSGEHCAVYLRSDRFRIEETETLWLSDTPRQLGSLGWGANLPRICTRVRVQERSTGIRVELFNTHFHWGEEITRRSTDIIIDLLSRVTPDRPAVLMGDFNLDPQSAEHGRLTSALLSGGRVLVDSYHEVHPAQDVGTSHGFSGRPQRRIDWILVSSEMAIHSAEIEMHSEAGRYPSDHFPVTATVELPEAGYQSSV